MRNIIVTLLILAILPAAAEAQSSRRRKFPPKPVETEVSLPIPQSEVNFGSMLPEMKESTPVTMELGVSSWSPSEFTRSTQLSGNQEFASGSLPFISLNRMASIKENWTGVYSKLGLSFASLEREVQIQRPGGVITAEQDLSLFSARIGAEYRSRRFASDLIEPVASLSALPTLALGSRSQVEGTVSSVGVPFEVTAGATFYPSFLPADALGVKKMSLGLGAQYLFGSVGGSKIDGLGAQGSLRVDL